MKKLMFFPLVLLLPFAVKAQQTPEIRNVAFFLQDGVEILDFAGPMEVFISAGFNVFTVAETKDPIKAMGRLTAVPDYSIEDSPKADMVAFFGGGGATHKSQKPNLKAWVQEQVAQTKIQFSVCTGAFFLGEVGLLDEKTATTFHSAIPGLRERFPKANVRDDVRFVDNGLVITTAGISAGIDGALHLVSKIHGQAFAQSVADNMEYFGWEPEKGLVIDNPFLQSIQENGLENALKKADKNTVVFKGELLNLGTNLWAEQQEQKVLAIFDYLVKKHPLSVTDCMVIGKVFKAAGRETPPSETEFIAMIENDNLQKARSIFKQTQKNAPNWHIFREWRLNMLGYKYLGQKNWDAAINVFQFNVEAFPKSFNVYDSLGEAYMLSGQKDLAIKNYEKSLELNPKNENGLAMLKQLKEAPLVEKKSK